MEKFQNQLAVLRNGIVLDSVDEIDTTKFPIPHKGDIISIAKFKEGEDCCKAYKVKSVEYAYKHFYDPENIITFIKIHVQ